jgi:hypothetical protein
VQQRGGVVMQGLNICSLLSLLDCAELRRTLGPPPIKRWKKVCSDRRFYSLNEVFPNTISQSIFRRIPRI